MTRKRRRLVLIGGALGVLAIAVALMLNALRDSIVFFNSPSDVAEKHILAGTRIRIGGLVKSGSVARGALSMSATAMASTHSAPPIRTRRRRLRVMAVVVPA